jgi:DNA gyrase/topoisomerase IV subunit A
MKAVIETETGLSTLKVAIDFNQLVRDNFVEVCKAIAIRRNAFKELLTKMETDNGLNGSIIDVIRKSYDESDAVENMCKELNFTLETAQYVINMPLSDLSDLNKTKLKRLMENHTEQIKRLLL